MAITTEIKEITPLLATQWLESSNLHNRPVRQTTVMKYARDMATGRWKLTHQGICFDESGLLVDGQHRLWAVVESNHKVKMMVTRGLAMDSQDAVDGGVNRQASDVIALRDGRPVPSIAMGVARFITLQSGMRNPTRSEQVACFDLYRDKIMSAIGMFQNVRGIRIVQVLVPFTRALYHAPYEQLAVAAHCLCDGMQHQPIDRVMVMLRNVLLVDKPLPDVVYAKTERAIRAYLDKDPIKILTRLDGEIFPLPTEARRALDKDAQSRLKKHTVARKRKAAA